MLMGAAGGMAGLSSAARAMGLPAGTRATGPDLPPASPGARVLVLGAGIAGLTAAYELERVGYRCTVVEARGRAGGRNYTIRDGSRVPHRDGTQVARFASGDYFNAGPARLPSFHRNVIGYCQRFGVALEPFVFQNHNAFVVDDAVMNGQALRHRRVNYSVAALADELVAKSMTSAAARASLSPDEFGALEELLRSRSLGDEAVTRMGFARMPDASLASPEYDPPVPTRELIKSPGLGAALAAYDRVDWQATLMQPVGGMDRIVDGFLRHLRSPVLTGTEVAAVSQSEDGVEVAVRQRGASDVRVLRADAVVVTLPLPILCQIGFDCSNGFARAMARGAERYAATSKMAWPARRRFWEEDEGVYGGASILSGKPMQYWYPSAGFGSKTGVMLGCYNTGENGRAWAAMSRAEQVAASRRYGERMHPAFGKEVGEPVAIDWIDQPYSRGGWGYIADDMDEGGTYATLRRREGRVVLAGDYLSQLTGWQEGAILSAYTAIEQLSPG